MSDIPSKIWSFFSGLPLIPSSKAVAESWLTIGEAGLVIFAIILGVGLLGEDRAEHHGKPYTPYGWHDWKRIFAWVVFIGVMGELFCDADIWVSSDALQAISDGEIKSAINTAQTALSNATDAETRANKVLQETIALERAMRPREIFNQAALWPIRNLPKVPLFVWPYDADEPKQMARMILFGLDPNHGSLNGGDVNVQMLPATDGGCPGGICVGYRFLGPSPLMFDPNAQQAAIAICKALATEGIEVRTDKIAGAEVPRHWPNGVPENGVIIKVGSPSNAFWMDKYLAEKGLNPPSSRTPVRPIDECW
jgi:hypothetical protein